MVVSHMAKDGDRSCYVVSRVLMVVGIALMLAAVAIVFAHPVLNLFLHPRVTYDAQDVETWVITDDEVQPTYERGTANWDGTLSLYEERYLIAHDWSRYGELIEQAPPQVVFGGETYVFDDEREAHVGDGGETIVWATSDGCLGMQTCRDADGVVVVRYRPTGLVASWADT